MTVEHFLYLTTNMAMFSHHLVVTKIDLNDAKEIPKNTTSQNFVHNMENCVHFFSHNKTSIIQQLILFMVLSMQIVVSITVESW